jgi:hypothetical protein
MSDSREAYLEAAQSIRAAFDEGFTDGAEYYRSPEVEQEAWRQSLAKEAFDAFKAVTSAVVPESAACVSPAPHYETQRGLSCKSDTQSTVVPKWISMQDQPPPIIGKCLGWNARANKILGPATYRIFVACAENTSDISHWMLLPEPPK